MRKMMRWTHSVRCLAAFLCAVLVITMLSAAVSADDEAAETAEAAEVIEEAVDEAAEAVEAALEGEAEAAPAAAAPEAVISSVIRTNELPGWPAAKAKASDYVCLLDTTTDTVLIDKNMELQAPPAALTKIMTVLVAIEKGNLEDVVAMTQTGVDFAVAGSANLYTVLGESFKLKDMLYGIMLESANDMAVQVAEHVGGGSVDNFVAMMNEKAAELGCKATHFVNPSGLPADGQVTTAYDFALIGKAAAENPTFREIFSAASYTIPATAIYAPRELVNNFPGMTDPDNYGIKGLIGGKTGYTDAALNNLMAICERSGRTEILVLLHCASVEELMKDAKLSYTYGYKKWKAKDVPLAEGQELVSGGKVLIPKGGSLKECTVSESVTDNGDGRERVDSTYYWGGVEVGTSSILRAKPTPVPTSEPAPVEQTAVPAGAAGTADPAAAAAVTDTTAAAAAGTAAAGTTAAGTAAAADPAVPAGTADAAAQAGTADAAAQAGAAAATGSALTQPAAPLAGEGAVTDQAYAPEQKEARRVSLPFGVTMNQGPFIAIAVLSLLVLIGVILILITAIVKRNKD